ncbi:winged helix-turn-helix transcriptional regulator [Marinomonas posidonica]|uniref:Transcriptional regulator, HxlR family n=1 Tax=Marinomonas posidonica (strain CECT 7376 / NCIMB 14433 / IVIA-Po-181) TaxID=491952 RepID=F6CVA0_MARPP|nr:transcriptional regulator, HxlR family [Marinomonas posidonica IVIA-Po-181]
MKKNTTSRSHCPITYALDILGDKWSLLIIRDMVFKGKKYYGEFSDSGEGISTNILADRLVKLESNGLISRSQDRNKRTKVIYRLTSKGEDLLPMLLEMILWSAKYDENTEASKTIIRKAQNNRNSLINEILTQLRVT